MIVFDEVQLCPKARQAIKKLVKDGRYDYIETGSLISIKKNVKDILIPSEERRLPMYPMDFEEFLWAKGDNVTNKLLLDCFNINRPLGDSTNRRLLKEFRLYMLVGGMPQAVSKYLETNNFRFVDEVKRDILDLYTGNFKKIDDTGLFVTLMFMDKDYTENVIYEKLLNDKLSVNLGYLYENVVAQTLVANGHKLYYHTIYNETTKHNYEIDFLIFKKNKICPIEVRSSGYNAHKSLDVFSDKYSDRVLDKYLVYTKDLNKDKDIKYIPIYMKNIF